MIEIKARMIRRLVQWRKWGGSHTENILGGLPSHLRGEKITKTTEVLKTIWNIEKKSKFLSASVPERKEPDPQAGETAQALRNEDSNLRIDELQDFDSQGQQLAQRSIRDLRDNFGRNLIPPTETEEITTEMSPEMEANTIPNVNFGTMGIISSF